ncbi:hypothetical protein D3C87_280150 [compost metagenome]
MNTHLNLSDVFTPFLILKENTPYEAKFWWSDPDARSVIVLPGMQIYYAVENGRPCFYYMAFGKSKVYIPYCYEILVVIGLAEFDEESDKLNGLSKR